MRKKEESLEAGESNYTGNMPGGRARGRPKMRWMDNIRTWTAWTGYEGATEIGGELLLTGMEECYAERVQPSDRGRIRTEEQNSVKELLPSFQEPVGYSA